MHRFVSVRASKKNAFALLKENHLWYPIFLLFFLTLFAFVGVAYLLEALIACLPIPGGSHASTLVSYVLLLFLGMFLVFPIWHGVRMLLIRLLFCGRLEFEYLFFFLRNKKHYWFSVRFSFRFLLRMHLYLVTLTLLSRLGRAVGDYLISAEREAFALLILLLCGFFALLLSLFFLRWQADTLLMDIALYSSATLSYHSLYKLSAVRMKNGRRALRKLNRSFIPHFLLSVLLLGLPLVFIIPYYITARACLAYQLIND